MDNNFYNTLVEIANSIEIDGSCSGIMDKVMEKAAERGIYGLTVYAGPIKGESVFRINSKGRVMEANWQDVFYMPKEGYIIDVDSPNKVYSIDEYIKKCFKNPDNVELIHFEES